MTPEVTIKRQLGLVDVAAVVIGGIIGVGIFFTPASLARQLPSPGWILALWLLGGFIAVMGAMVLAELGGQMPRAGGFYVFLREGFGPRFGPPVAFLYGWINLLVIQPGAMAIIALILVQNLEFLTGPLGQPWASGIGIAAIAGFTWANARGLPTGAGLLRAVTAL